MSPLNRFILCLPLLSFGWAMAAVAQPLSHPIPYEIRLRGTPGANIGGSYAILNPDGTYATQSFDGTLPQVIQVQAPRTATVSASGGSLVEAIDLTISIYQNGKLCAEANGSGRGNFVTTECLPSSPQSQ
ncbi:hypothetical protein DO97_17640 [Neosynechococcus sphagnicola sy1]|uniref:Uncharacterized protein n=1 Tax=Neosynechococcus sphagnicola sy1 TaxID=1497020 RepID=A0A098TGB4_9CYAN|nr:hypothetical protein [Neosynechococcus sphagnicola]KGF71585.1 hypothetical protein DO97_17640 [Neosynechococcus sphagnicola sy1]